VVYGLVALAAFMCLYYALMGLVSTIALGVNLLLLIALLSMLQATLTLPGIAAIALTHRRRKQTRHQDPGRQVKVRARDRLRVLSMPSEKRER